MRKRRRRRRAPFLVLLLFIPLLKGQVIIHDHGAIDEDGNPAYDDNGVKDKVVVWKGGGTVHALASTYHISAGYTLKISPGAIVKPASIFNRTPNGVRFVAGGGLLLSDGAQLQVEGATITDVRDDSVGGDTNEDGSATRPPLASEIYTGFEGLTLRFGYTDGVIIRGSTLKYVQGFQYFGAIQLIGNHFFMVGDISSGPTSIDHPVIGKTAYISGNTFEMIGNRRISLNGLNAVVENNEFRYAPAWYQPLRMNVSDYTPVLFLFPYCPTTDRCAPQTGTTVVSNNRFYTGGGVEVRGGSQQEYEIRDNIFESTTEVGGQGNAGILFWPSARATITGNTISNYRSPVDYSYASFMPAVSLVKVNGNRFNFSPVAPSGYVGHISLDTLWKAGIFIDVKNNYWGHPTGPRDTSNIDGIQNPFGQGFEVINGIEYRPFVGQQRPTAGDRITIAAQANPSAPLTPGAEATIAVTAEYKLASQSTGRITAWVRDENGFILNAGGTNVTVSSQDSRAALPAIRVTVPTLSRQLQVDTRLEAAGPGGAVASNIVIIPVRYAVGSIRITGITDADTGSLPDLVRGCDISLRMAFQYTISSSSGGTIQVESRERIASAGTLLQEFPSRSFDVPPGTNVTSVQTLSFRLPLRDVLAGEIVSKLTVTATLRDSQGKVLGQDLWALPVQGNGDKVWMPLVKGLTADENDNYSGRQDHLLVGENPVCLIQFLWEIRTKNASGWYIITDPWEVLDKEGKIIQSLRHTQFRIPNLSTGRANPTMANPLLYALKNALYYPLPPEAASVKIYAQLIAMPEGITVAASTAQLPVRNALAKAEKTIPAGPSQQALSPLPVSLDFTSNQAAGQLVGREFAGPPAETVQRTEWQPSWKGEQAPGRYRFAARYWSLTDSLADGTFTARLGIAYDAARDFPGLAGFQEDRLVLTALNIQSGSFEPVPTTLDRAARTVSTPYHHFYCSWALALDTGDQSTTTTLSGSTSTTSSTATTRTSTTTGTTSTTTTTTSTTTTSPQRNRCDLNGDGLINILDIQQAVNCYLRGTCSADINCDGRTDVLDIQTLVNIYLNAVPCPACGQQLRTLSSSNR